MTASQSISMIKRSTDDKLRWTQYSLRKKLEYLYEISLLETPSADNACFHP